ncbi:unnamed protein product, partial [Brenthis ino]
MYLSILLTLLALTSTFGHPQAVPAGVASPLNPYYAGRNSLASRYSPYYNPASATVPILTYSSNQGIDGSYDFSFTTGDGKQAQETGYLKSAYIDNTGAPQGAQVKEGSFSYVSPEGTPIQLNYVADENGFRPLGFHIPADGRGVVPAGLLDTIKGSQAYDPRYNLYDPYNGNLAHRQYNPLKPYDARYPTDPNYYNPYNPYRSAYNTAYNNIAKGVQKITN